MSWHVAVDLGAGSGRAMLGHVDEAGLRIDEVHRFHYAPRPKAGRLRWDIQQLFDGVQHGIACAAERAAAAGGGIESVGVDSWGVDYGLLDADGRLCEDPVSYRDDRTNGMMEQVFASIPRHEVFARTGVQSLQLNTLYQLAAHVRDGLPAAAARLLLIPDLCHHRLCGARVSERSDASTTQLLNVHTGDWDDGLMSRLGLPRHLMPPLVTTGSDLGPLCAGLRRRPGLAGTRVLAPATHDTASAVAATPLTPGWAYISSGTWSLVGVERREPILGDAACQANFTNEVGAYGTVRFLKNVMGLWLLESCRREWQAEGRATALPDLLSRVAALTEFQGFVVPDSPRFFNPASMVRELQAALRETGQASPDDPVRLTRVVLDSLALRYASVIEAIEKVTGATVSGIHIVGGGSLNDPLNQATADATGRPVLAGPPEATAIGSILAQAIASATLPSLEAGRELVRRSAPPRRFEPARTTSRAYATRRYRELEAAHS